MAERFSIEFVRQVFEERGYTLLSTEYKNNATKLAYRCPKGHEHSIIFGAFRDGRGCPTCWSEKRVGVLRLPYEEVKKIVEGRGFTLLAKEYEGNHVPIEVRCPRGHVTSPCLHNFRKPDWNCAACAGKKKHTLAEVREIFGRRGYTVLSRAYKNCMSPLEVRCPEGHVTSVSLNSFTRPSSKWGCSRCYGNRKYTLEEVKEIFKKRGYVVLSTRYKGNCIPIEVRCPKGHVTWMALSRFLQESECRRCAAKKLGKKQRHSFTKVKRLFEQQGYVLKSTRYIASHMPLEYVCRCGADAVTRYDSFKSGHRCPRCGARRAAMTRRTRPKVLAAMARLFNGTDDRAGS